MNSMNSKHRNVNLRQTHRKEGAKKDRREQSST
jgi:hypothetical protein